MTLYDYGPSGNGYKVRLLLAHLGLQYQHSWVDLLRGEARTESFRARNPNGKIPVLELEDGRTLAESNAIMFFLAQGTPYWPESRLDQTEALQWLFFEQYSHEPNIATVRFWLTIKKIEMTPFYLDLIKQKQELGRSALQVDVRDRLGSWTGPTLLIIGTEDLLLRDRMAEQFSVAAPDASVAHLPGPHLLLQVRPNESWQAISEFINR